MKALQYRIVIEHLRTWKDIERHRKHRGFVTTKTYLEVS